MIEFYYIPQWGKTFENAGSRKVVSRMAWVPFPTRQDGAGYRRVVRDKRRGCAILGAWMLTVEVAAKCPVRGALTGDQGPLTFDDMEMMTGVPRAAFEQAFAVLVDPKIGWLAVGKCEEGGDLLEACRIAVAEPPAVAGGATGAPRQGGLQTDRQTDKKNPTRSGPTRKTSKTKPVGPEPDFSNTSWPDRTGGSGATPTRRLKPNQVFRLKFLQNLAEAFGWSPDRMMEQRRAVGAVARRLEQLPPDRRDELAQELVALAKEKQAAGLDKPEAAWQAEVKTWDLAALEAGDE